MGEGMSENWVKGYFLGSDEPLECIGCDLASGPDIQVEAVLDLDERRVVSFFERARQSGRTKAINDLRRALSEGSIKFPRTSFGL